MSIIKDLTNKLLYNNAEKDEMDLDVLACQMLHRQSVKKADTTTAYTVKPQ